MFVAYLHPVKSLEVVEDVRVLVSGQVAWPPAPRLDRLCQSCNFTSQLVRWPAILVAS